MATTVQTTVQLSDAKQVAAWLGSTFPNYKTQTRGRKVVVIGTGAATGIGVVIRGPNQVKINWQFPNIGAQLVLTLAARGAIPHAASLGLSDEGVVAETCSTPGTTAFRLLALAENPGARRRDGLRHGLLAVVFTGLLPGLIAFLIVWLVVKDDVKRIEQEVTAVLQGAAPQASPHAGYPG